MFHAVWTARARRCPRILAYSDVGRTDRLRFVGLPPRILARGPARLGRPQGTGAVDFPGRRQCRKRLGAPAGRADRDSVRAGFDRVVRAGRAVGYLHPREDRKLVQTPVGPVGPQAGRCRRCRGPRPFETENPECAPHLGRAGLFEVFLYRFDDQLLHVLPDGEVLDVGAGGSVRAFRVPRGFGGGDFHRRSGRRPRRAQIRDLGLDPRRGSLYADASLCGSDRDHRAGRRHRTGHLVGFLGHSGLCHRPDARQGRHDRRGLLRADVRTGRPRLGLLRVAGRPDEHRIHLPGQHSAAPAGRHHGLFAEHRIEKR